MIVRKRGGYTHTSAFKGYLYLEKQKLHLYNHRFLRSPWIASGLDAVFPLHCYQGLLEIKFCP